MIIRVPHRRRWWLLCAAILPLIAWIGARSTDPGDERAGASVTETGGPAAAPSARPEPPSPLRLERTSLGRGGTLDSALLALEVPDRLRQPLIAELRRQLDVRRLAPATGLLASLDDDSRWRSLSVRPEAGRVLRIVIDGPDSDPRLTSSWIDLPVEIEVRTVSGVVEASVAQALSGAADGAALVPAFADIFQWDVDLLVDPRPGDRVRIVYESRRLGSVPADLPGFSGAPDRGGEPLGAGRILAASYAGRMARAHAFWVADGREGGDYFDLEGRPMRKTFLKSPLNYRRISSRFSAARRNPVTRKVVPHHGVDYAARSGTPVVAAADGRVISAGWDGALGRAVRIRHGSEYVTIYGHLRGFARGIRGGVSVRQDQVIGYVGATGRATGPHLHYAMVRSGRPVDPLKIVNPPVGPLEASRVPELELAVRRWRPLIDLELDPSRLAAAVAAAAADGSAAAASGSVP